MKNGPWTIKKRKKIYENSFGLKVWEDEVVRPDGLDGIHGLVNIRTGVGVLPVDDLGFAYLTKEFHYAVGRIGIETAAGAIDEGETPIEAAKRELKEELGITAKKWDSLGLVDPLTTVLRGPQHLFLARKLEFGDSKPEGTETISLEKMPFTELVRKCLNGEITSALTIATVFMAREKLKNDF